VSIATRRGDDGTTGLLNGGRVPKDHPRIEALGAFDELNVEIGAARMLAGDQEARELLRAIQSSLVAVMGEVAGTGEEDSGKARRRYARLAQEDLDRLDKALEALESRAPHMEGWATPGGTPEALALDRARVAARRAERRLVAQTGGGGGVRPLLMQWTNRLSDVLWLMARAAEPRD
jgi:cob(I)alamin adenosyltransferase